MNARSHLPNGTKLRAPISTDGEHCNDELYGTLLILTIPSNFMHPPARGIIARRFFHHTPVQRVQSPSRWQQSKTYFPAYAAIGVCCSGFAYNYYADNQVAQHRNYTHRNFIDRNLVLSRENYDAGRWWTTVTHSLMHFHALHLACNMVALASFGPTSAAMFGLPSTAIIWIGSSFACSWATLAGQEYKSKQARSGLLPKPLEIFGRPLPHGQPSSPHSVQAVGSSSAILGLFAAVACARPRAGVFVFPIPIPVPMGALAVGFGLASAVAWSQDLLPALGHTGHIGGMAFGALFYALVLRRGITFIR